MNEVTFNSSLLRFQSRGNLGNFNVVIIFHRLGYQQGKTGVSFWSVFLGAGISFQILAPTLEKALFSISSLDFLI